MSAWLYADAILRAIVERADLVTIRQAWPDMDERQRRAIARIALEKTIREFQPARSPFLRVWDRMSVVSPSARWPRR